MCEKLDVKESGIKDKNKPFWKRRIGDIKRLRKDRGRMEAWFMGK